MTAKTRRPAWQRHNRHGETVQVSRGSCVVAVLALCVVAGGLAAALTTHGSARVAWTVVVVVAGVWSTATLASMLFVYLVVLRLRRARSG